MIAHRYHHNPEVMPPMVITWGRVGDDVTDGPMDLGACYALTDAQIEAMVAADRAAGVDA